MYYSNDEIGKTVSLITSAPKDLEVGNTYWCVWVITLITVDIPLELGGWGCVYHRSFGDGVEMFGLFMCLIGASGVTLIFGAYEQSRGGK